MATQDQITTNFAKQFGTTVDILAQQEGSVLRAAMGQRIDVSGEEAFIEQLGPTTAQRTTTRNADSPLIPSDWKRRKVSLVNIEWGELFDRFDRVRLLIDPENPATRNAGWAIGREQDDVIIEQFFADAKTGKDGSTTVSFPASQQIAADFDGDGTKEGLTIDKLIQARKLFKQAEVRLDRTQPWGGVNAEAVSDLLGTVEVTSRDFSELMALQRGEVEGFMGFRFVSTERWELDSASDRRLPFWVPEGMGEAVGAEPTAEMARRADKRFNIYVYWSTVYGAVRTDEVRVVEVKIAE